MPPLAVVKDVNVVGDLNDGLGARLVAPVVCEFVLERAPAVNNRMNNRDRFI